MTKSKLSRLIRVATRYWGGDSHERASLKRRWFFDLSRTMTPLLGVEAPEGVLLVQTDDVDLGRGTFADGPWDQEMVEFAVRQAEAHSERSIEGGSVLEIGANVGTTTLLLLNRYRAARVIAFEPIPRTARILRAMLALNGLLDRVDVREVALTDQETVLQMELSQRSPGDNRVRTRPPEDSRQGEADRRLISVRGTRLDAEVADLSEVRLVWMDAQGHEGHVLAGARNLLAGDIPVISEFWPYALRRAGGLEMFLKAVEQHYARVFDTAHGDRSRAEMYPSSAIRSLAGRYPGPGEFTDLILLKH